MPPFFLLTHLHRAVCQWRRRTTMTASSCSTGPTSAPLLAASSEGCVFLVSLSYPWWQLHGIYVNAKNVIYRYNYYE